MAWTFHFPSPSELRIQKLRVRPIPPNAAQSRMDARPIVNIGQDGKVARAAGISERKDHPCCTAGD